MIYDYLIVGAGFSGATYARMATNRGKSVLIIDKRDHIGGNSYDFINKEGLFVQKYGPHIFHTSSKIVWDFLSRYSKWNDYEHRVLVNLGNKEVYLPINIETMEKLYDRQFTPENMKEFLNSKKINIKNIENSRDVVLSQVGKELYNYFFKNYTKKQWGVYPEELDASVLQRIPVRFNRDTRYFEDKYQGIPIDGFTELFEKLLDNKNITVKLNTDYKDIIKEINFKKMIFTGPIDSFFDFKYGKLPYRSIDFEFKELNEEFFQSNSVINYPNDYDYTRITEFKHFYFQKNKQTIICYEYPKSDGDPFYPIPRQENRNLYLKYKRLADNLDNVFFTGRLAEYKYINMDKAVENALNLFHKLES